MQRTPPGPLRARQWGKAGPIMALVSILIIAVLAKVTLAQFGFTQTKAAAPAAAIATELEGDDAAAAAPTTPPKATATAQPASNATANGLQHPPTALDKARAVQGLIDRQTAKTISQIETEGK